MRPCSVTVVTNRGERSKAREVFPSLYCAFCSLGADEGLNIPRSWVVLSPNPDKLIEVMRPQDGRVSGQILKVIHYDCHKQVQHLEDRHKVVRPVVLKY